MRPLRKCFHKPEEKGNDLTSIYISILRITNWLINCQFMVPYYNCAFYFIGKWWYQVRTAVSQRWHCSLKFQSLGKPSHCESPCKSVSWMSRTEKPMPRILSPRYVFSTWRRKRKELVLLFSCCDKTPWTK